GRTEDQLCLAASGTGRAMRLARYLDDGASLGHVLRMHGNELRKAGRGGAAITRLTEAAELSQDDKERGQTLILLARAAGEQGNAGLLDDCVIAAERLMDTAGPSGILFTPFSLREVRMRGLMGTGRAAMAAELAQSRPGSGEAPAPQWATIQAVLGRHAIGSGGPPRCAHPVQRSAVARPAPQAAAPDPARHTKRGGGGARGDPGRCPGASA